jgi:Uma2 family endonuclease
MTSAIQPLTLEEFRTRYADEKPYFEYWFGEAVQKTVPTWLHSLLVKILLNALDQAGYVSGTEVELRTDPDWQPKPDVLGALRIEGAYAVNSVEVVVEVISPEDRMQRLIEKCRQYARINIPAVFVMDPQLRYAWVWSRREENLERISVMLLPNGKQIGIADLWDELDRRLEKGK